MYTIRRLTTDAEITAFQQGYGTNIAERSHGDLKIELPMEYLLGAQVFGVLDRAGRLVAGYVVRCDPPFRCLRAVPDDVKRADPLLREVPERDLCELTCIWRNDGISAARFGTSVWPRIVMDCARAGRRFILGLGFEDRMNDIYQVWSPIKIYVGPSAAAEPRKDSSTLFRGVLGRVLFWSFFPSMLTPTFEHFVTACEGVDAVLYTRLAVPVPHVAERLGVPCFAAFPVPHTPTEAFENPLYVRASPSGPRRSRATYALEWGLTHQLSHRVLTRFRRERLGLPAIARTALRDHLAGIVRGTLYAYSEAVVPRPPDWNDRVAVTGYWFRDEEPGYAPPPEVERFLADGDPPVCVSFGSMKSSDSAEARRAAHRRPRAGRPPGALAVGLGRRPRRLEPADARDG